jgi:hypothetical protein
MQLRTSLPLLHDFKIRSISYTRPPTRPRRASGALGALQGREGNDPPSPPAPQTYRAGVPGALGPAGPGHGSPCGPLGWRRKRPQPPGTWRPSRGPQGPRIVFPHAPASGPLNKALLGTSRPAWGPSGVVGGPGGRRAQGGPRDPWAEAWVQGAGGPSGPGGPRKRRRPCALQGTAAGPGAPASRPGA